MPFGLSATKKVAKLAFSGAGCWACANVAADPRIAMAMVEITIVRVMMVPPFVRGTPIAFIVHSANA